MEEIKVGEYVRTKQGEIAQIVNTNMFDKTIYKDEQDAKYYLEDIVKHSFNIIDLIEVGDYVNGERMDIVDKDENGHVYYLQNIELPSVNKNKIESILTKEQFASMEYRLED